MVKEYQDETRRKAKRRKPPIEWIIRPFQAFARHKLAGAGLLLAAAAVALAWANSPWKESYHGILEMQISMSLFIGGLAFGEPALRDVAKLAVLSASLAAGCVGLLLAWTAGRKNNAHVG